MAPDLLVVGHIVKDLTSTGWQPGGSIVYAATQAKRLGLSVGAVTACGPDVNPQAIVPGVEWQVVRDKVTTTFENRYVDGRREQRVLALARVLSIADVPVSWRSAPIIFLAPIFHDLDPKLPFDSRFKSGFIGLGDQSSLIGLGAQGWLRRRDGERVLPGRVKSSPEWLLGSSAVFVSEEDIIDPESVAKWQDRSRIGRAPIVVLTRADRGCTVWDAAGRHDLAAIESESIDPTGAGDVFACAFLVRLHETGDTLIAARFAAAAAALNVHEVGLGGIGTRAEIESLISSQTRVRAG
jgi:hypothetical protein